MKTQAAANRAELNLRQLNTKASAYYNGTDGFTVYECDGEFLRNYQDSNDVEKFASFKELEQCFTMEYEYCVVATIADEFKELYQGWSDDILERANRAGERCYKAEKIVDLYNRLYGDDWTEDIILNDHEKGYLTINTGRDGEEYAWYADENNNIAVNLVTGAVIGEEKIEKILT